jgi:malonate decarboxylase alpha subunit
MSGKILWNRCKLDKADRKNLARKFTGEKEIKADQIVEFFETIIKSGDKIVLEGNNQKQASFLSESLAKVDANKVNHLHMIIPSVSRTEHLDLFEDNIAEVLEFSYAGSQSLRIAQMIQDGNLKIGSIHTYLELYSRLFVDLIPNICLVAADKADRNGNLYTGNNTEETPTLIEAAAFNDGIVIAQVNEITDTLDRVDIPGGWVDYIVESPEPYFIKALFTKDPRNITELQVLMGMMCIKGIYAKHGVKTLNHGIGFNTAAIELLLPTYGESLGLKGKICTNWVLNPHPTLIPAIESGWVKSICSFGGELGMEKYIKARPDVFATGPDGSLRSNRTLAQLAGLYAIDMFIGSTLQMDHYGNSSTVTAGRLSGFGGAPNMGHNPGGRRHSSEAWQSLVTSQEPLARGRKLVVQVVETFGQGVTPVFVEKLDAVDIAKKAGLPVAPVMIYGDDVSHVVTEQGIAYLYKAESLEERKNALRAIAGVTPFGRSSDSEITKVLRKKGVVAYPSDLDIKVTEASRNLLAAKNMEQLVEWSGGLYEPPKEFKSW